ncbi:MAG: preprotein translocase subunit SecA [Rickettsiales bacterium]|jgi:preprotein translocase subunit SecA|nr:preprotein translocase subunit SecA [Rickettsiales bacterium]
MMGLVKRVFKSLNRKRLQQFQKIVSVINSLEPTYLSLSDENLRDQTDILRNRLSKGETLDDILPNAFAIVREAARRTIEQRHFDVQLIGGIVLHRGEIAEMKTGEGKTLVATLPSYLNALEGKGVHVVTVNDYLAKWQSEMMAKIHNFLGLTCGCILHDMDDSQRREAYNCDITYGTNSEFGFDYLRDNMKYSLDQMVQKPFNYAIVDEVDSILIDEARTPLIISGATNDNSTLYEKINSIVRYIPDNLCNIDEKDRQVAFTEEGNEWIDKKLKDSGLVGRNDNMWDIKYMDLIHIVYQALKAHKLFKAEVDYIVRKEQVFIVDEFTGRVMEGRRFSDGLHQALEAKENVRVQNENQTLASITYQNYFRMYPKLSGMTGTAMTEATEFEYIYGLKTIEIPTNRPVVRKDEQDEIYRTQNEKYKAIVRQIEECNKRGQPVLVGTVSVEKSEIVSNLLKTKGIAHQVLNAKYHEKESKIIAQAGQSGSITIATNMAGRGTDIMLGGNLDFTVNEIIDREKEEIFKIKKDIENDKNKVVDSGGLYILGTERHESRRIDNQLRGRSGRQGDPGVSKFFLSMEDDLLRIFGGEKLSGMMEKLGLPENEAIIHPWISSSVEKAQKKVENAHYEARKQVLKYDDVVNEQRLIIFEQRMDIIKANDISEEINFIREEKNNNLLLKYIPEKTNKNVWNIKFLNDELTRIYGGNFEIKDEYSRDELLDYIDRKTADLYSYKEKIYTRNLMRQIEKQIYLLTIDKYWKEHLRNLDHLRQGISYRSYAQKDPLLEYKKESFMLFEELLENIREDILIKLFHVVVNVDELQLMQQKVVSINSINNNKISRNDACPCGSGKKYKHCCGKET